MRGSQSSSWFRRHLYPVIGITVTIALLAGGGALAVMQAEDQSPDPAAASRTSSNRSAAVPLELDPEPSTAEAAAQAQAVPPASRFEINCPGAKAIPAQNGDAFPCKVVSVGGFSSPVSLSCVKPPAGLTCAPDPATVTPPAGGSAEFHIALGNNNVKPGKHKFQVVGKSGDLTASFTWPFDTSGTAAGGDYRTQQGAQVYCSFLPMNRIARGETVKTTCGYQATFAFKGTITPNCVAPPGITCSISPDVSPRFPVPVDATLTLTAAADAPLGPTVVAVKGTSPSFNFDLFPHNDLPFQVVTASGNNIETSYSMQCGPPVTTLVAWTKSQLSCEVSSEGFAGALTLMVLNLDPNGPRVTPPDGGFAIASGGRVTIPLTVDATTGSSGNFRYVVTVQPPGAYNFSPTDNDKSRSVAVHVTPSTELPPEMHPPGMLPPLPQP